MKFLKHIIVYFLKVKMEGISGLLSLMFLKSILASQPFYELYLNACC